MATSRPDRDYLDAFLQGARFALFALEARLRDTNKLDDPDVQDALDEFHELYQGVRTGMGPERMRVQLPVDYLGKN